MRKILLVLLLILTTTSANATQMCARRDTTVIPLDSSVDPKLTYKADRYEQIWSQTFDYGTVYGIATCLSKVEIADIQQVSIDSLDTIPQFLNSDDDEYQGRSGYYNNDSSVAEYARTECYCKTTHPMSSLWYRHGYNSVDYCDSNCADRCGHTVYYTRFWRTGIFNTIGQAPGYIDINTNEYGESIDLN